MTITFNTNVSALTAQRYLGIASDKASSSLAKLTSGSRVPTAKDDAAALAIGTQLQAEVSALGQASNNASQATSLLQIADGALSTTSDILNRMKTLAVQASSGQLADSDRALLNQEYSSLQNEVDRIANVTNFNGASLLAGSTTVTSDTNNLVSTGNGTPGNLIGQGFDSINFASNYNAAAGGTGAAQTGAISISYDSASKNMTVTDLVNNKTQTVNIGTAAVGAGKTQAVDFNSIGVTINLNSQFSKAADINATAANTATSYNANTATITQAIATNGAQSTVANTPTISAVTLGGTGTYALQPSDLATLAVTLGGTAAATTASGTITVNGQAHTFTTTATSDLSSTGAKTLTLSDGHGNTFTLGLNVATAPTAGSNTYTGGVITVGGGAASIEAGTMKLTGVTESATAGDAYNFGNASSAAVTFTTTTASSSTASLTLKNADGTNDVFSTAAGVDLTTAGTKNITLADANGNQVSFSMNVLSGVQDNQALSVSLGSLGSVVAANATTTADTTFSFKVGTGTTANDDISFSLASSTQASLGISGTDISTESTANAAISATTAAITTVASQRATIGAAESRLGFATDSVNVAIENTTAAESGLMDVDVSSEITQFSSQQVLLQAGVSLLAQANQQPSLLLKLLQ